MRIANQHLIIEPNQILFDTTKQKSAASRESRIASGRLVVDVNECDTLPCP